VDPDSRKWELLVDTYERYPHQIPSTFGRVCPYLHQNLAGERRTWKLTLKFNSPAFRKVSLTFRGTYLKLDDQIHFFILYFHPSSSTLLSWAGRMWLHSLRKLQKWQKWKVENAQNLCSQSPLLTFHTADNFLKSLPQFLFLRRENHLISGVSTGAVVTLNLFSFPAAL
jgi:hypothetical protein